MRRILFALLLFGVASSSAMAEHLYRSHAYFESYRYPHYRDRPCYLHRGRFYYGGRYRHGCYRWRRDRFCDGRYYPYGYRHYYRYDRLRAVHRRHRALLHCR